MCDLDATGAPSIFKIIGNVTALVRMLPTLGSTRLTTLVVRGTGIPKDRDEVNKREVSEFDG